MERGLLTGKMIPGQNFKKGDHRKTNPYFTDDSIIKTNAFLAKIKPIADEKGINLSQLVLRWTIDHPGITIADGAVLFPDSGRLIPFAAQQRSERSLRLSSFVENSRVDFLFFNAVITASPRCVSGAFSCIVLSSLA